MVIIGTVPGFFNPLRRSSGYGCEEDNLYESFIDAQVLIEVAAAATTQPPAKACLNGADNPCCKRASLRGPGGLSTHNELTHSHCAFAPYLG